MIYLPFPADREETTAHGDFGKWILKYIDDCFKIAGAFGCGIDHMEDIVLVTGRHLARSWINVAFSGSGGGVQVSFKVQVTGDLHVNLEERDVSGAELKLGPSGEVRLLHSFGLMLRIDRPDTFEPGSTREPMHFRSRVSRCPHPEYLAKDSRNRIRF